MSIRNDLLEQILAAVGGGGSVTTNIALVARSVALIQEPSIVDTPLQIEFGPAQGSGATAVEIDTLGNITINESRTYNISLNLQVGRAGGVGVSNVYGRLLVNGVQPGGSALALVDNADIVIPLEFNLSIPLVATDVVTIEIYRDSNGSNSGGLSQGNPTLAGWSNAETASISIIYLTA